VTSSGKEVKAVASSQWARNLVESLYYCIDVFGFCALSPPCSAQCNCHAELNKWQRGF